MTSADTGTPKSLLQPGRNCWRIETATRAALIIDADDYFRAARASMCKARRRIMLVGWDFDARISLDRSGREIGGPHEIAALLQWLVARNKDLEIYILRWDVGALKSLLNGRTLLALARWIWHPRISVQLDAHHPIAASHHQKIVVIDDNLAFCGGIDMTGDRWDTRAHLEADPLRKKPDGAPYNPWHDATTALEGPIAAALGCLCRERWAASGRKPLAPVEDGADCWPDDLEPMARDIRLAISRTVPTMPGADEIIEIEHLYVDLIAAARRSIYIENQYLASRKIAIALAASLEAADGPEIVIVNPQSAQGWIEPLAMDTARARLHEALRRRDVHGRFRLYYPVNEAGTPIYVHAKIMIIDDRLIRIGSSNLNNRSLGLDTECDVTFDAALTPSRELTILPATLRLSLVAEHLGVEPSQVSDAVTARGSLIGAIEELRRPAGRTLKPYIQDDLSAVESFLAENQILDPEGPDEMFEALANRGLFRGWSHDPRREPRP